MSLVLLEVWITVLSATEIVLLEEPRVGRPASFTSLVAMNRPVIAVSLLPSWFRVSLVL